MFTRNSGRTLLLGSVKTNLGHSEAVSGITSVIKVTLAMEHSTIPSTIGIKVINPDLKIDDRNIKIVTQPTAWPTGAFRASVNSFGYGGANAHIILERPDASTPAASGQITSEHTKEKTTFLLPFSARKQQSVEAIVKDLADHDLTGVDLADLAYTLTARRSTFSARGFLLVHQGFLEQEISLSKLYRGKSDAVPKDLPAIAFVFSGQGAQWPRMGYELIEEYPTFRSTIQGLDTHLKGLSPPPSWTIEGMSLC